VVVLEQTISLVVIIERESSVFPGDFI
jgi:hypothetical protein